MTPNRGQWDERILYNVDLNQGKLYLENNKMTFFLTDAMSHNHTEHEDHSEEKSGIAYQAINQTFLNANENAIQVEKNPSSHYSNYILGADKSKWKSEVLSFSEVHFKQFYPNIDLFYTSRDGQLSYNFKVLPFADPSHIKFALTGAESVRISEDGALILKHRFGEIRESAPLAWTEDENGNKTKVACRFEIKGDTIHFNLPNGYDENQKLIIDPSLTFSTFTGSTADNWGFTATPDINGNLFGGGIVFSSGYPLSTGAYDVSFNSGTGSFPMDVGITKYTANGNNILYSTYIGGSGNETPHSIVCAPNGELYIYGATSSTNFPMAGTPYDNSHNGGPYELENSLEFNGSDIYVARLNSSGTSLLSSTYIGGSNTDGLNTSMLNYNYGDQFRGEITLDENNNVYISSTTASSNFPTVNAAQTTLNGSQDAVVFKLNPNLSSLSWSTYFGGSGDETGNAVSVGTSGSVYVVGGSTSFSLPINSGNDLSFNGGLSDGYALRLNTSSGAFQSGTFMGLNEYDQTYFVDIDPAGGVYVYGQTESSWSISSGCYGVPNSGQFIRKYTADLSTVSWTTMIGSASGHVEISPTAFLVSDCYDIYLAGWGGILNQNGQASFSTSSGFPITPDAYQTVTNGSNFYLAVLDQDASFLKYATFMGGTTSSYNHVDGGTSRFDKSGRIYHAVCGACGGNDYGFTSTPGSWSPTNNSSNCNMATFKFELSTIQAAAAQPAPLICIPQSVYFQNNSTNGNAYLWNFGDGNTSTQFEPIYQYSTPGIYDVTLVVLDTNGCFSADSVTITVNIGAFEGGVVPPASPICPGDNFQFEAYGGANYSWSPAQFLNNPSIYNPVATITQTTTFNVTISDSCGSVTVPVTLEVYDNSISISPDTSICIGNNVQLNVNSTGTISWTPSTYLNNATSFSPVSTPEESMTYTANVINQYGCENQAQVTIDVYFNPPVPVMADTVGMCRGGSVGLVIYGGDTYQWQNSPYLNSTQDNLVIANPPIDDWFFVTVTNACGSAEDSIFVQVVEAQIQAGNDTIICPRETAILWATGASYYEWNPSNTIVGSSGNEVEVRPTQTTNYQVVGTDQDGCKDTAFVLVQLYPYPSIFVTPNVLAFYGDEIQLEATTNTPGTFTWYPTEFLSCSNCPNPITSPNQDITYFVDFIDINGCSSTAWVNINYDAVVYVPNTFVPDENGINDVFQIYGGNIKEMECLIFNRWGELICTLRSTSEFWDGTYKGLPCQDGTYTWKLTYKDFLDDKYQLTGHVNLLR
jgi:gliding motility-associated-like protein